MRTMWLWVVLGMTAAAPVLAGETAPNTLTPAEISGGWISLFDGQTDFGWKPRGDATFRVADSTIEASGSAAGVFSTTTEFADFELKAEVMADENTRAGIFVSAPADGPITAKNAVALAPKIGGKKWSTLDVRAAGGQVTVLVNGKKSAQIHAANPLRGTIAFQYDGKHALKFRNIVLHPLSLKSIFNGKDLTGWQEVPGHKSVFSVTPEGWLNVKNGNGDLHTLDKWGDFVLQLEVFSNGTHLNSGVFYRGNFGKFWEGYECQVRNQWQGDDRTKAVDYGTGGIYNRQPARKVVSSDHEWFSMTVIAHGLHMASWVNGYQVTDFQDTAPLHQENARAGARTAPGIISIQGHDPTTDLSFRKIQVIEMPALAHP